MSVTTGRSSVDASGNIFIYQPPGVGQVNRGYSVAYGTYQQINAGDQITLTAGVWQFANGSGQLQATGTLSYRVVTVTPGPVLGPVSASSPQTTGAVGISPAPSGYVYVPPNASAIPVGVQPAYGSLVTIEENDVLPNLGYIEVQAGAPPTQAVNLALVRTVTFTPL